MLIFIFIYAIATFTLFLYVELNERHVEATIFKTLASLGFLLIALYSFYKVGIITLSERKIRFVLFLISGLFFGLVGDVILSLRDYSESTLQRVTVFGTISFFIGHILYMVAMYQIFSFNFIAFVFGAVVTSFVFIFALHKKYRFQKLFYPSVVYSFILFTFVGQNIFTIFDSQQLTTVFLLIGSILFAGSDLILSEIYYHNNQNKLTKAMNLILYYGAQYLIASSILFL